MARKKVIDFKRWEIVYLNSQGVLNDRKKTKMINVSDKAVRTTLKHFGRELQNTLDTSKCNLSNKITENQNGYIAEHFKLRERNTAASQITKENVS